MPLYRFELTVVGGNIEVHYRATLKTMYRNIEDI